MTKNLVGLTGCSRFAACTVRRIALERPPSGRSEPTGASSALSGRIVAVERRWVPPAAQTLGNNPHLPLSMPPMHLLALLLAAAPLASGISQERVEEVVADRGASLQACYEEGLSRNKDLKGAIAVKMTVADTGRVTEAKSTQGTTMPDAEVVTCVVDIMKTLEFGTQEAPQTVRYALAFAPDPPAPEPEK